jgi:hypothetical protein
MRSASFLIEPQNQGRRFICGLASKPLGRFVSGLTSKPLGRFINGLASKPLARFLRFGLKIGGNSFLVEPQNQGGGGFPGLIIWALKSLWRFLGLCLKIKRTTVYQLCHKTDGRATVWDTHRDLAACFARK